MIQWWYYDDIRNMMKVAKWLNKLLNIKQPNPTKHQWRPHILVLLVLIFATDGPWPKYGATMPYTSCHFDLYRSPGFRQNYLQREGCRNITWSMDTRGIDTFWSFKLVPLRYENGVWPHHFSTTFTFLFGVVGRSRYAHIITQWIDLRVIHVVLVSSFHPTSSICIFIYNNNI